MSTLSKFSFMKFTVDNENCPKQNKVQQHERLKPQKAEHNIYLDLLWWFDWLPVLTTCTGCAAIIDEWRDLKQYWIIVLIIYLLYDYY